MPNKDLITAEYTSNENLVDLIVRIKQTELQSFEVSHYKTKDFTAPFVNLYFENSVLRYVVKNQWRSYKYNQEYIHFLLNGYTEEEFVKVAEQYALPFEHIDKNQLSLGASVILNVLGEEITSGDLSSLLNVDPIELNTALETNPFVDKCKEIEDAQHGKTE
jgi:hypothetical protein